MMEDDLTRRLRALGTEAVPPGTSAAHLTAMASVAAPQERRRFGRLAVGLAALTGFAVGGSGLAMAGALPGPAQEAAAGVLAAVGVEAPRPASNAYGQCVSAAARAHGDDEPAVGTAAGEEGNSAFRAAKSACGEPGRGRGGKGVPAGGSDAGAAPTTTPKGDDDPCTGPPPWAGRMSRRERAAAKQTFAATCPERGAPEDEVDELDEPEGDGRPEGD